MDTNDNRQLNKSKTKFKKLLHTDKAYKKSKSKKAKLVFTVNNDFNVSEDSIQRGYMLQTTQKALKQKTSKGKIINLVCFGISILILVVTLLIQRETFGITDIEQIAQVMNLKYLGYTVLAFFGIMLLDSARTYVLIRRATGTFRPSLAYKSTAICRYYDCITPFSFGGQPFQIYYLSTRGVKGGIASSVPLAKYIFSQISFCLMAFVLLIIGIVKGIFTTTESQAIMPLSIVSLVLCFLFLGAIIFISVSKRLTPKVVRGLTNLGHKLKLIKNVEISFTHYMRTILEYQKSIWYYLKSFWISTLSFILSIGISFLKGLIPYMIYLCFVPDPTVLYLEVLIKFTVCELVTMFIPLPGGSGMAEISFTALFASLFQESHIFWAMLIYRIATYYAYLLQGIIVSVYDIVLGDKRNKKYLEKHKTKV